MLPRCALAALLCAACYAQTPAPADVKAPESVDKALRARITQFYTLLQARDYRKAEALVAADTKDYYYEGQKPQILRFQVLSIKYSDHFKRADAITECVQKVAIPGFPEGEWSLKIPSTWRYENKNWFWFVDQSVVSNPVGLSTKVDPHNPSAKAPQAAGAGIPKDIPTTTDFALGKVMPDKDKLLMAAGDTEKITITNRSMGAVKLILPVMPKGLKASLDKVDLNAGDKAVLTVQADKEATGGLVYLQIAPTNEVLAFAVSMK